jgi:hypothetical protein
MPVSPIYLLEISPRFIVDAALDVQRDKIIGSWDKMLVVIANLAPGLGNQISSPAVLDP